MLRRAFTMRLKPGALADYQHHHDHLWPELADEIERSGIGSITTFQRGLDLFLVSEISDEAAWDRLWNSAVHKRWAQVMEPLMNLTDDGIVAAEELSEVFHFTANGHDHAEMELVPVAMAAGTAYGGAEGANGMAAAAQSIDPLAELIAERAEDSTSPAPPNGPGFAPDEPPSLRASEPAPTPPTRKRKKASPRKRPVQQPAAKKRAAKKSKATSRPAAAKRTKKKSAARKKALKKKASRKPIAKKVAHARKKAKPAKKKAKRRGKK